MAAIYGPRTPFKFNSMEIPWNATALQVDDHCAVKADLITGTVSHHIKTTKSCRKSAERANPLFIRRVIWVCGGFIPAVL